MKTKRERGQGSIGNVPGSRFLYIWYYDSAGQQHRESTKSTLKSVAQEMLNQRLAAMARGEKSPRELHSIRYEDMRTAYLANCKLTGKCPGKLVLDEKGVPTGMTRTGLKSLDAFFGGMRLQQIDTDCLQRYRDSRKCSESTKNRCLGLLRAMMNLTVKQRRLQFTMPHFPMASEAGNARQGFVEPTEFRSILARLPENLRPLVVFLYFTGCRIGAALKIGWDMVSMDCTTMTLPRTIIKNKEPLVLALPTELTAMLRKKFRQGDVFDATGLRGAWKQAAPGVLVHDLRRSGARNLRNAGVDETVIMKIGGWKTRSVFIRYAIVSTKDIAEAMGKVEANNASLTQAAESK